MPTFLSEILTQLRNIWAQLSGGQRLMTGAVLAGVVIGMFGLVLFATRPDYVAFGNGMEGVDRSAVLAAFEEARIDYRIENGVVLVNGSQQSDAEKALVSKGLRGDNASAGADEGSSFTHDRERRSYALQLSKVSRVEAQIKKMRGVRSVQINLYEPSGPNILRAQEPRRASVVLGLSRSSAFATLAPAVRGLVSNSLGIANEDVMVSDTDYHVLNAGAGAQGGFTQLMDLQNHMSGVFTMQARSLLERLFPGKTHVVVNAEYDNKVIESQKKIVSSDKIVVKEKSYKTKDETGTTASGDPNGVGTTASASAANGSTDKSSSVTQVDRDYQPIIGEESVRLLAPDLKRLSVSLSIDESLSAMKTEIETQVKNAIGWSQGRDTDVVAMVNKFEDIEDLPEPNGTVAMIKEWAPLAGQILSVLFVLFFLKGLLKRNKASGSVAAPGGAALAGRAGSAGGSSAADAGAAPQSPEDSVKQTMRLRKEIEKVVADDPASVSRMLESWLANKESA